MSNLSKMSNHEERLTIAAAAAAARLL